MPSSASVCAEPRWARITTRPIFLRATCTATAPEVVRTFRTYATARTYLPSTPNSTLRLPKPQVTALPARKTSDHVLSQVGLPTDQPRVVVVNPARDAVYVGTTGEAGLTVIPL